MKIETSNDVLADGARRVVDAGTLASWIAGCVNAVLPHAAMLCGQSVPHAGGYAAIQRWSFNVPQSYEAALGCVGSNVRSPILARLMHSGGPEYFDPERDMGCDVDVTWRRNFTSAGWRNLLGFGYGEGEGNELVFTSAAFYNVDPTSSASANLLQQKVMPHLHAALSCMHEARFKRPPLGAAPPYMLTPAERAIASLLVLGKTNKEIGKQLQKSDETVKRQLANMMKRLCARNRMALARLISNVTDFQ